METTAKTLRELIVENRFESTRLSRDQIGKNDYAELTKLYREALDALTAWACADYMHIATQDDQDRAFSAVKAILQLYATDENRIVIDASSMRTMRDLSTKPTRLYSKAYKEAHKALKEAQRIFDKNWNILKDLGATMPDLDDEAFDIEAWKQLVLDEGKYMFDTVNMLELFLISLVNLKSCQAKQDEVKKAGKWTWRRAMPVSDNVFADLVENYIGDCLDDDYNIKSSKTIRDEKTAERKARAEAKAQQQTK